MSHVLCPRQVVFTLPGAPGVQVTATEVGGNIEFIIDVQDTAGSTGDLRALFFHINEAEFAGLQVTSGDPLFKEARTGNNSVLDLGDGANLSGKVKDGFDVGTEWGTPGGKKDDISFPVSFTLSNTTGDLTLDDIGGMLFGAKLDSVGGPGGPRGSTAKLTTIAPFAPDAIDDEFDIFEDGAADLNSPSKDPAAVTLDVLGNDTDADTPHDSLIIEHIVEGPSHGTVEISADGKYIYYTPNLDYSGTDSFWYCMTDGNGGQDSALCTVNIEAVADDPVITFAVAQGSHINETLVTVTATQNDVDGSEDMSSLDWAIAGGTPAGVTITPLGPIAAGADQDSIVQQFVVTTAPETDWDFDIDFTGVSAEDSNADTESHTEAQSIVIDYTSNFDTLAYEVVDQSIWSTGDEFVFDYEDFLGINPSISGTVGDDVITGTYVTASGHITAGFDVDVHFEGGQIDATIPIDVTVNTTYNKTTDTVYIDPSLALGSGGSFITHGPEGSFLLDFIFDAGASVEAYLLWVEVYADSFSESWSQNIFDLDSSDPAQVYTILGGLVDIGFEWPHLSVTGGTSGSGTSNDFLFATLDVDQLANFLLGGALSFLDTEPTNPDNFELLDFDITGGLNFIQEFALGVASTSVDLVLEDGTIVPLTFGSPITISNASAHDLNGDGTVEFDFGLDPNVTLSNETILGGNIDGHLWVPKNFDVTLVDEHFDIVEGPLVTVFEDTFALTGVGSQNVDFVI